MLKTRAIRKRFGIPASKIYAIQWSSVLSPETCDTCRRLDGMTLTALQALEFGKRPGLGDRMKGIPQHPQHPCAECSCVWVIILTDEVNPPPITGPEWVDRVDDQQAHS